jgi:hypothetical protein
VTTIDQAVPEKQPEAAPVEEKRGAAHVSKRSLNDWMFDPNDRIPTRITKLGGSGGVVLAFGGAVWLIIFNLGSTTTSFSVVGADRGQIVLKLTATGPASKQSKVSNFELSFGDDLPIRNARLRTSISDASVPAAGLRFYERIGRTEPTPPPALKVPLSVDGLRARCRQVLIEALPDRYTRQEIAEMVGIQTVTLSLDAEESNGRTRRIEQKIPAKYIGDFILSALPDVTSRVTCP